jgi:hypothetical protein
MSRLWKSPAIAILALVISAPVASARGMYLGFGAYSGGFYGPGYYPGFVGPGWGYGPWYGSMYYPGQPSGEVQIVTKHKGDSIYVDGGLAGRTGELKKFPLRAGSHTIELRNTSGHAFYQERITVIPGKKLKIQADYPGQP